jgi:hypothetical protein
LPLEPCHTSQPIYSWLSVPSRIVVQWTPVPHKPPLTLSWATVFGFAKTNTDTIITPCPAMKVKVAIVDGFKSFYTATCGCLLPTIISSKTNLRKAFKLTPMRSQSIGEDLFKRRTTNVHQPQLLR